MKKWQFSDIFSQKNRWNIFRKKIFHCWNFVISGVKLDIRIIEKDRKCVSRVDPHSYMKEDHYGSVLGPVWPDWAIYWTLVHFLKPLATIYLSKSLTFLDNFCKCVKIYNFLVISFLGNFFKTFGDFFWSHCQWPNYWWP